MEEDHGDKTSEEISVPTQTIHPGKNGVHANKKNICRFLHQDAQATEAIGDGTTSIVLGVGGGVWGGLQPFFPKEKEKEEGYALNIHYDW